MDILQLPALSGGTPIKLAWSVLNSAKRSALITAAAEQPGLITVESLAIGENRGAKVLDDVEPQPVPLVTSAHGKRPRAALEELGVWSPALELVDPESVRLHMRESRLGLPHHEIRYDPALQNAIDEILTGIDLNFALVGLSPGAAILVSRYESAVRMHAVPPRRCYCQNPSFVHGYDNKVTGDPCDLDEYTVRCRR